MRTTHLWFYHGLQAYMSGCNLLIDDFGFEFSRQRQLITGAVAGIMQSASVLERLFVSCASCAALALQIELYAGYTAWQRQCQIFVPSIQPALICISR